MSKTPFANDTDAAKAGLNLTLSPVENYAFAGLVQRVNEVFGLSSVFITSSGDRAQVLQRVRGNQNAGANDQKIAYPLVMLSESSRSEAPTRWNSHALARRGLVAVVTDSNRAYRLHLLPQDFTVTFEYITNSAQELAKFMSLWALARRLGWLKFTIQYGRLSLDISVVADGQLSVPKREASLDNLSEYTLEATLTMAGFIGSPTLIEQQVITHVNFDAAVTDDAKNPSSIVTDTFWSFTSPIDGELQDPVSSGRTT